MQITHSSDFQHFKPEKRADLNAFLHWIWHTYFQDISQPNEVIIVWGYPRKNTLGRISLCADRTSLIEINVLLQRSQIPEEILLITIAHELTHYAHGFGSPLPRKFPHPHAHQVVDRELKQRELGTQLSFCESWIADSWSTFYQEQRQQNFAGLTWFPHHSKHDSHP